MRIGLTGASGFIGREIIRQARNQQDAVVALRGNQDALVADRAANSVTLIVNAAGSPGLSVLGGPDQGIDAPTALWFDSEPLCTRH